MKKDITAINGLDGDLRQAIAELQPATRAKLY